MAWSLAAATLNAALAPRTGDELRLEQAPPPAPAQSTPQHHDDLVFDPSELISV